MSDRQTSTLSRAPAAGAGGPKRRSRPPIVVLVAAVAVFVLALIVLVPLFVGGEDPEAPGIDPVTDPVDGTDPVDVRAVPAATATTADAIVTYAQAEDWESLAALALEGGTPFTATFGEDLTTVEELAAYWRGLASEEDLPRIIGALVTLPDWHATTARDASGYDVTIYVTPAYMHTMTETDRAHLEEALSPEWLEMQMADGQYLGWRIGITEQGDWQFFVQGD